MIKKKLCARCYQKLDISLFNNRKASKDGFQGYCRKCSKEYFSLYYQEIKALRDIKKVVDTWI